ncbi:MAG: thioredoxin fold domain-containing protein [Gammaproteobacteria bacterium]|nr:thioredoxin fold domain-containing protein [Gammaproteobacteria bacterium]NNJ49395.1 thioredoxin fold domain-containing protein [Gammaproteobacteria bacterium]
MSSANETYDAYELEDEEDILPHVVIQYATDFSSLAKVAREENKIIMLEVSASYCGYCDLLEEEFIKPMLRNDYYSGIVLIRKIDLDSYQTIIDFSGNNTTPDVFARDIDVVLTPTILFFDGDGNEVSQRILGINTLDLYGGYIEDALNNGLKKIKPQ